MSQFDDLLPFILKHEGVSPTNPTGYVNDPKDPGGETKWGISQRAWGLLRTQPEYANFPTAVRDLDYTHAVAIYNTTYYLSTFDELPPGPALVAFDCQVNEGIAIRVIQRAIGTIDDNHWGPQSEQALRLALRDVPMLIENLLWKRIEHYVAISKPSPVNQAFLAKEWMPRLVTCRTEALRL